MSVRVGLGVAGFPFSGANAFWRWVDLCEESGVDSIWLNERLVSLQPTLEPLTALAMAAGRTRRLKFGLNAVVLPLRDPLVLAKECATIDYLSDGRLLPVFGVGGDTAPEWKATGRSTRGRGERSNETLVLLQRLWSEDHVSFQGKHFSYDDVTISPKPRQQPLPIWIGGSSEAAIERTAGLGTGWLGGGGLTPDQAGAVVAAIKARLQVNGRVIDDDHYGLGVPFRFGSWEEPAVRRAAQALSARLQPGTDPASVMAIGDAESMRAIVEKYVAAGLSKFVFRPIADSDAEILEQSERLATEVLPIIEGGSLAASAQAVKPI